MFPVTSGNRPMPGVAVRFVLVTTVFVLGWVFLQTTIRQSHPILQVRAVQLPDLSEHASAHPEARAIHDACLQHLVHKSEAMRMGVLQLFKKKGEDRFIILCKYGEPDLWGIEVRTADGESITAFRPDDGLLKEVLRYILEQATRYTGNLPWFN